jgi:hypothetical protein
MVQGMLNVFEKIYSIELSHELYQSAKIKFKKYPHVHLYEGDSSEKLHEIVNILDESTLFWLDGHYSGGITAKGEKETPILDELKIILSSKNSHSHIILIDDARCFGKGDYPSIDEIKKISSVYGFKNITVESDIIRIFSEKYV